MTVLREATAEAFALAEGPLWDAPRRRLLWVDILGGAVLEGVIDENCIEVTERHEFGEMVGAVAVADDGALLVAATETLVLVGPDGSRTDGPRLVPAHQRRRLNDARTDPAGRLVVGTLSLDGPSESEELVRLESNGRVTTLDGDLSLSNGLAWSADGRRMYSVDTYRRAVYVRDYDPGTGETGERRVHVRIEDGFPDGIALDAEEHLWVAVWGRGEVRRFDSGGLLVDLVTLPAPHVSSVAFAGDDLHTLVVTTATSELTGDQLRANPLSGRLFVGHSRVPGLPAPTWSGSIAF
ncbi:SMP-30/gluconolactonase/LRE family protein [Rhodococcus sp. C26F]